MEAYAIHLDRKLGCGGGKNPLPKYYRPVTITDANGDV